MKVEELKSALKELGWKQADFARKTGIVPNTISRWMTGEVEIPVWAEAHIALLTELQRLYTKHLALNKGRRRV